jgi:hypothetical protein
MKRRRHTPEQIVRKLREADRLLGEAKDLAEVLRVLEVSESTLSRWRTRFGGIKARTTNAVRALNTDIRQWIEAWNVTPPYMWPKTTEQILAGISRYCQPIHQTRC